jgi:hypothetical protein
MKAPETIATRPAPKMAKNMNSDVMVLDFGKRINGIRKTLVGFKTLDR